MELETWIGNNPARRNLIDRLTDPSALDEEYAGELRIRHERPARDMALRIRHMHRQHTRRRVFRVAAAIAATTVIGAAAWLYITGDSDSSGSATPPLAGAILSIDDIAPGKTGAVYKTANGDAVAPRRVRHSHHGQHTPHKTPRPMRCQPAGRQPVS